MYAVGLTPEWQNPLCISLAPVGGGLEPLLSAGCLAGLEWLGLADCRLIGPYGDLLTTARWRPTLTAFNPSHHRLQAAGLRRLFAADWPRLREL